MKKLLLFIGIAFAQLSFGQSIISVTPNNANRGQNIQVTITADDLDFNLTTDSNRVAIIDQFSNIINATFLSDFSPLNQISAFFNIPSYAIPGQYDVNVYDDFGSFNMTLANGFTVNNAFTYTIQGNIRYDSNGSGCSSSSSPIPNQKLLFTNGSTTGNFIANSNGFYSFYGVQVGNNNFSPILENPNYFTVTPPSASATISPINNLFIQDFCVTPNGIHNDLEVTLIPITNARPGFNAIYKLNFKNKGTSTQNGAVSFNFNDAIMDLISSSPTFDNQSVNSLNWNFSNLLPFESREIFITLNINSPMETPAVNAGNILNYSASINGAVDETPLDNSKTLNQTVVGSFDPNDKTCIEGNTISPEMVGKYVHYIIRFENTGTANAENVVIRDFIDTSKFEISSLIPLSASANYITRINLSQVEFVFENINLPFDEANNDGYIVFKIKTKPTLAIGDVFRNRAQIFFDYNFPIVTNNYETTVTVLGNQDFETNSFFNLSPIPTKDILTISKKQEINLSSVSIYNALGQLVQVVTNPTDTIDVSTLKTGNYFIKIMSDKGSATSKFIKE